MTILVFGPELDDAVGEFDDSVVHVVTKDHMKRFNAELQAFLNEVCGNVPLAADKAYGGLNTLRSTLIERGESRSDATKTITGLLRRTLREVFGELPGEVLVVTHSSPTSGTPADQYWLAFELIAHGIALGGTFVVPLTGGGTRFVPAREYVCDAMLD